MSTITPPPLPAPERLAGVRHPVKGLDAKASNDDVYLGRPSSVPASKGQEEGPPAPVSVEEAIVHFKQQIQSLRRELEFTFDEETRQVIIRVHDSETGEVVRQIPSEEFVAMARRIGSRQDPRLIDTRA